MGKFLQASFFFLSSLFFIVTIIIIRTRGAWLGLLGEGVLFLALLGKNLFKKRYLYILILLLISIIPLFFFKETSPIGRIKGTFKVKKGVELTGSALVRIYIWKSTLDLILHHPLGVGPDSLKFTIPLYLLPDYWTIEGGVLDKAHNIILEIAATTGWLGILSYTSLWIALFIFGIRNRNIITIAILSSSTGYLIQNLFNFDLKTKNYQAEIYHYLALVYFKKEDYKNSVKECQKAVNLSPDNVSWLNDLGSAYYKAGDLKRAKEAFEKALSLDANNDYARKVLSVIEGD
ncbi:MAG: O-antigen ligase family protein [bacterium]